MPKWNQPAIDLAGERFGQLVAKEYIKGSRWICRCDCGKQSIVTTAKLTSAHTRTCGTHKRDKLSTSADYTPAMKSVYQRWSSMRARCRNPNDAAYANYGGRGITTCPTWESFDVFLADVGIPDNLKYQLDRIDNGKGYEKGNVHWVPQKKNLNNKRSNRNIEFGGRTQTIAEWAQELNINYRTLNNRINRGWEVERALTTTATGGWSGS